MDYCPSPQTDTHGGGIVIKVTWQSANMKRASFRKVRDDDLNSFQHWLLCAPADDLHHSCGTMHHGLCSSQSYSVNETTWSQATGTLSKKKEKKRVSSALQEGWRSRWRLHASRKVSSKCGYVVQLCRGKKEAHSAGRKLLYAFKRLNGHNSTVLVCFHLFFSTCVTRITNKTQVQPWCANSEVQLLISYQIFIPFSLECTYMTALHERFWINGQSALKCKYGSWCLRFLVASFLKSSLQWEYFRKANKEQNNLDKIFFFFLLTPIGSVEVTKCCLLKVPPLHCHTSFSHGGKENPVKE